MIVNHERIARMMREDNLLAVREVYLPRRSLRIVRVHLNLASRMTLSGPDQLWAADITSPANSSIWLLCWTSSLAKSLAGP
jgi:putative transposase